MSVTHSPTLCTTNSGNRDPVSPLPQGRFWGSYLSLGSRPLTLQVDALRCAKIFLLSMPR